VAYAQLTYDPWDMPREERQAVFVGRENLLRQLVTAVEEQQDHQTVQHYLVLGPRGIGKTTILLTLRDRIQDDAALSENWFCVQLREEEYYIRTLRDLLDLTLQGLAEDEELSEAEDLLAQVHEERDDEKSLAIAIDGLRSICETRRKRILLLIDNFDRLFPLKPGGHRKKLPSENQYRAFRKLLSTDGFLMVVGASVRLFEEIAAYDQAFFNFFCPIEIPYLTDDEIHLLLQKRARAELNHAFLRKLEGLRDQVRAVTFMTGGNPRLVLLLYDVLRQRELRTVVQSLRETVSGLTPMLKHIMDDMPRQQSKTLDALVRLGEGTSPSSIAEHSRLPLNVVTTQLGRLKDARFVVVEGGGKGRPAAYRIADPMFRTWYQMRYLRPAGRRIELFVEFLRALFSTEERRKLIEERWQDKRESPGTSRAFGATDALLGMEYYIASLEDQQEQRKQFNRLADRIMEYGDTREAALLLAENTAPADSSTAEYESAGYMALGDRLLEKGELERAIEIYREALRKNSENVEARTGLGVALGQSGEHEKAMEEFDALVSTTKLEQPLLCTAHVNRGLSKYLLGDTEGAIADYTAVVDLPGALPGLVAKALFNRGLCMGQLGDIEGAISDYCTVVSIPGALPEHIVKALVCCGIQLEDDGDHEGALQEVEKALLVDGVPRRHSSYALFYRAHLLEKLSKTTDSNRDFTQCAESGADITVVHASVEALVRIALQEEHQEEAISWMSRLCQLEPADTTIEQRLEFRIGLVTTAAREASLRAAESILDALLASDEPEVRERIAFLKPAISFAGGDDEHAIASLPQEEQEIARRIAASLTQEKSDRSD